MMSNPGISEPLNARAPSPLPTSLPEGHVYVQAPSGPKASDEMGGMAAPFQALGDLGSQLHDEGMKLGIPDQEAKGADAVTRDPNTGELSVQLRTPLTEWDTAYNHAALASYTAQSDGDRRLQLQQLAQQNLDDPQKFQVAANAYLKTQVKSAPGMVRGDLMAQGTNDITQFTENLVSQKRTRDTREQLETIKASNQSTENDIYALAHNGGTQTPEFQQSVGKLDNQLNQLRNPVFGVSDEEIKAQRSEILSNAEAEATLGHAVQEGRANGVQSGQDFLDKAIWSTDLNLSPGQREAFASRGRRELNEMDATNKAAQVQLKQQVEYRLDDAGAAADTTGDWTKVVSPNEIMQANRDDPSRAMDIISRLNSRSAAYSAKQQVKNASPADLAAMDARLKPGAPAGPAAGYDAFYNNFLGPHEGGYTASDGNGQPANFGVNQGANPDIDVKNLTQDQAKQILKDRYWTASGADQLPPALAALQGDTAVNMGVGTAKDLLEQSGGDAQKYLQLRDARYRQIAADNPAQAANLPTWLKRNADLASYVKGAGYDDQVRTYKAFQQAVQERNEALTKDPAAYVLGARPDIAQQLTSNDAATAQMGVRASLTAQRDLGVQAPTILTKGQVGAIVQQFNTPQDPTKPADGMNTTIDGLAQQYGNYFPQVMDELQKKGLPPEASSLYQVRGQGVSAVRMATAINSMLHMGKDLNAGRDAFFAGAPNNSEIRKALPGTMGDYVDSFAGNPQGPQQVKAMTDAVNLYAHQLSYEGVNDPQQAAQKAHDDLIGSKYNFVDGYRVPKGVDQSVIQLGATAVKTNLSADNLEPYANAAPGVSMDDRRAMTATILTGQGKWVTRSDDKGLSLVWPQSTGYLPAIDASGKPISMSWSALQQAAQAHQGAQSAQDKVQADYLHTGGH